MHYEIFMRLRQPDGGWPVRLDAAMAEVGASQTGAGRWTLSIRGGAVWVRRHPEGDGSATSPPTAAGPGADQAPTGLDLRIPGGASEALARQAWDLALSLGRQMDLRLFDPQLGREVGEADGEAVLLGIRRMADYVTETVGLDGGQGAQWMEVDRPGPGLSPMARFYLILGGAIGALLLLAWAC